MRCSCSNLPGGGGGETACHQSRVRQEAPLFCPTRLPALPPTCGDWDPDESRHCKRAPRARPEATSCFEAASASLCGSGFAASCWARDGDSPVVCFLLELGWATPSPPDSHTKGGAAATKASCLNSC